MNKLLKVTLLTAIMATSGMCGDRCQHMTFNANITYSQSYTISHDNTWITETTGNSEAYITGDVKITDRSRWKHDKGGILLEGKDNIIDNSELVINEGGIGVHDTGKLDIKDKSSILVKGYGMIVADGNNNSDNGATINIDKSTICMKDCAGIGAYEKGTININEGSIFDARDSKDLSGWNTASRSTFNMEAGSIMYLPSTDIDDDDKKAYSGLWPFIITLPSEGDKPVELRYIQHIDITFDGLCPNVTPIGYKYTDLYSVTSNTGIGFNGNTDNVRLTPIYTWSVSTKCDGEDVKILESRDLQCCDDILW